MNIFHLKKTRGGFTLIELLVVITIIGMLSGVVLVSLNSARAKGRDSTRRQVMVQLRTALELYYAKNGKYPITGNAIIYGSDSTEPSGIFADTNGGNWIPGLVASGAMSSLPKDPRPGVAVPDCGNVWSEAGNQTAVYGYASTDGTGYVLANICGMENAISSNDPMWSKYINDQGSAAAAAHTLKICVDGKTNECGGGSNSWF